MLVRSILMKSGKRLARDVFDTRHVCWPCSSRHCITSLISTARHKMTALTVVFLRLSNVDWGGGGRDEKSSKEKKRLLCASCLFNSY